MSCNILSYVSGQRYVTDIQKQLHRLKPLIINYVILIDLNRYNRILFSLDCYTESTKERTAW